MSSVGQAPCFAPLTGSNLGWSSYNSLPSVESAHGQLGQRQDFSDFLADFGALAKDHDLLGVVGAFLLHRHFALKPFEAIVESPHLEPDGTTALHAKAVLEPSHAWPTRWSRVGEAWVAREYSSDAACRDTAARLSSASAFVRDLADLLTARHFNHLLGVAGVERRALPLREDEQYVEVTKDDVSITRTQMRSQTDQTLLGTLWVPNLAARCEPDWNCMARCIPEFGHHRHDHDRHYRHRHLPF